MREFVESPWEPPIRLGKHTDPMWAVSVNQFADEAEIIETARDAWKEAFLATRAYYSNNNGENSKRYRKAVARLKEMKLIK